MTLQEAVTILETHQRWRLGAEIQMEEPKVVTKALDVVLEYLLKVALEYFQNEISDAEIEKIASEYILYNDSKKEGVIEGMKLYREQLKKTTK